jgi:D-2-hydroxyacid dehydrogenase (NADP+)
MTAMLLSKVFVSKFGDRLSAAAGAAGVSCRVIHLPDDGSPLSAEEAAQIEVAYLTRDLRFSNLFPTFAQAITAAPQLGWVHFASTGINQHPFLPGLIQRGVRLTTSAGTDGEPVGHTAIGGLLMLARGFPRWMDAQRRHAWEPTRGADMPRDLNGQTVLIVGMGTIGATIARFCQALGMYVIGVRRTPIRPDDPVDEMHAPAAFRSLLPQSDWVVLACPLTSGTHHLINPETLALLPQGARVINVARGGVVDEAALIAALRSGHIGGAYLDVFEKEPLPPESPLWGFPGVIISPHSASVATDNEARAAEVFTANLVRWVRGEAMMNERHA